MASDRKTEALPLGRRQFTLADQRHFAALTGDANPVHLDPLAARRTLVGHVVVHGMHTLAWALETYLATSRDLGNPLWQPRALTATFSKPVFLDADVELQLVSATPQTVQLRALQDRVAVLELRVQGEHAGPVEQHEDPNSVVALPASEPTLRKPEDLEGLRGAVDVVRARSGLRSEFPVTSAAIGTDVLARLLAVSTVVGMECPGLHSLLSKVSLALEPEQARPAPDADEVTYEVRRFAAAYSLVDMTVRSAGLSGSVMAFLRPAPAVQPTSALVVEQVERGEFADQRALIIGGSRGLGELTAKIVAAGGGAAVITYRHGEDDARRVAEEIRRAGGTCALAPFDVTRPEESMERVAEQLDKADIGPPTHLYYYATPRISGRRAPGSFDDDLFRAFSEFYVRGFLATVTACRSVTGQPLRVLYPSTVFVDDGPQELVEYAAAKAAGEAVARMLTRSQADVTVTPVRFPRLPTDQTAAVQQLTMEDPLPIVLEAVRALGR